MRLLLELKHQYTSVIRGPSTVPQFFLVIWMWMWGYFNFTGHKTSEMRLSRLLVELKHQTYFWITSRFGQLCFHIKHTLNKAVKLGENHFTRDNMFTKFWCNEPRRFFRKKLLFPYAVYFLRIKGTSSLPWRRNLSYPVCQFWLTKKAPLTLFAPKWTIRTNLRKQNFRRIFAYKRPFCKCFWDNHFCAPVNKITEQPNYWA